MKTTGCDDCTLSDERHAEIADALSEASLDVFARADMAADAIDLAEVQAEVTKGRPRIPYAVLGAAALLLVGVLIGSIVLGARDGGEADDGETPPEVQALGDVAAEREANLAFYESDAVQKKFKTYPVGSYVGIAGGETIVNEAEPHLVNNALKKLHPKAAHRYVFAVGMQGNINHKTYFGTPPFVGSAFINRLGLGVAPRAGVTRYWRDDSTGRLTHDVALRDGKGSEITLHVGSVEGMETVKLLAGYSTASTTPLVLARGMGFPRWEIPGIAKLKGGSGHPGTFRRYLVSISIPELGLREVHVEAMGIFEGPVRADGSLTLAGHRWAPLDDAVRARSKKNGKPLLLLERPVWLTRFPGNPFEPLSARRLVARLKPFELAWEEVPLRETWAGSTGAPPAGSRLAVYAPGGVSLGAELIVNGLTRADHVRSFLDDAGRKLQTRRPNRMQAVVQETVAIATLRHLVAAQAQLQASGLIDQDRDGVGEYGGLAELTGFTAGRMSKPLDVPLVTMTFPSGGKLRLGVGEKSGYCFVVHVVAKGGKAAATEGSKGFPALDVASAEKAWWAYAYPQRGRRDGFRTFYVDQRGEVWATKQGAYRGHGYLEARPHPRAAFADPERVPGGVSPALLSADGHRWERVK